MMIKGSLLCSLPIVG